MWRLPIQNNPKPPITEKRRNKAKDLSFWRRSAYQTLSKALNILQATTREVPDLLKVLASWSETTVRRCEVDREDLKPYWKSEKRPHFSRWSTILEKATPFNRNLSTESAIVIKVNVLFPKRKLFVTTVAWLLVLMQPKWLIFSESANRININPSNNKRSLILKILYLPRLLRYLLSFCGTLSRALLMFSSSILVFRNELAFVNITRSGFSSASILYLAISSSRVLMHFPKSCFFLFIASTSSQINWCFLSLSKRIFFLFLFFQVFVVLYPATLAAKSSLSFFYSSALDL